MPLRFLRNMISIDSAEISQDIYSDGYTGSERLINRDGSFNIQKQGNLASNIYEKIMFMSWWKFVLYWLSLNTAVNLLFAFGFMAIGTDKIRNLVPGSFFEELAQAFFFSIQTFTTVGYGYMNPEGVLANLLASFAAFSGLSTFALATGLFFVKFSTPRSNLTFSQNALIVKGEDGKSSFQFRVVNNSKNSIVDPEAMVTITWMKEIKGKMRRQFMRLDLELERIHLFPLNWTIIHKINEKSPFFHKSLEELKKDKIEVLVMIKAFDEVYSQTVNSKISYSCDEIIENASWLPMYEQKDRKTILDTSKINNYKIAEAIPSEPVNK